MDLNPNFNFQADDRYFPLYKPNEKDYNFEEDVILRLVFLEDRHKTQKDEIFALRMTLALTIILALSVLMFYPLFK